MGIVIYNIYCVIVRLNPLNQVLVSYVELEKQRLEQERSLNPLNQVLVSYVYKGLDYDIVCILS